MPLDFTALEAEVSRNTTVDGSAKILITRFASEVAANKNDPAKLQALVDAMRASSDDLAGAVAENTPAEVPPVEPPVA